eukprot:TRINITY_DN11014_c0_g1_i13.p1 TRINITY_DN11014_c0_g1~~TRINITY_DN11014_c0_g1_i13.p1  ORF type:complete len:272 (+),score=52.86 TRINITY_DN11014_c0_g1_i13:405-1220(+)
MATLASLQEQEAMRMQQEEEQMAQAMEAARLESVELAMRKEKDTAILQAKLDEFALTEVKVPRDGNCQFHAIVDSLEGVTHSELRAQLVDWLEANPEYTVNPEDSQTAIAHYLDADPSWSTFCGRMRQAGQYGDHLTLIAAAECTGSCIVVITSQADGVNYHVQPRLVTPMRTIYLVHYPMQLHFNLAVENAVTEPLVDGERPAEQRHALAESMELSQHLVASFTFLVCFSQGTQRMTTMFHPHTGRLSVGTEDVRSWVADECNCPMNQVC